MTLAMAAIPFGLALIMLGLGLSLKIEDFRRVARFRKGVFIGLVTQMIVLPGIAFLLTLIFALPPELAIGVMILAASPGGPTANFFSHLARGDVALNLTLTAMNSVLCVLTLPLIVNLSLYYFLDSPQTMGLFFAKFIEVLLVIIIPVLIGISLREQRPKVAALLDRPVRVFSLLFLVAIITGSVVKDWQRLQEFLPQVGGIVLCFNILSLGVGYGSAKLFRLEHRQATAIAMEIGIHNGALAIYVALSLLGNVSMATPAAAYSLLMYLTAGLAVVMLKPRKTGS